MTIFADSASESPVKRKPRVQSAARTVEVLVTVARASAGGISAKELAEGLKLPRQIVYHLLHTLAEAGIVRKAIRNNYVLGLGAAPIADGFSRQMRAFDPLGEYVQEAARITGETTYVSGWVDGEVVTRVTARGSRPIGAAEVALGTTGSAHCRASGKLLLAMLSHEEVKRYIARHPLRRMTPHTLTTTKTLTAEFERIRRDQISVEVEEFSPGVACMAVPMGAMPTLLVLALSAPVERFLGNQQTYANQLRGVAARINGVNAPRLRD